MFYKAYIILFLFLIFPINLYNDYNKNIIGIISIPKYDYENKIIKGIDEEALSSDLIGSYNELLFNNHIILAGHNKPKVFRIITKLKKNDIIEINNLLSTQKYIIKEIYVFDRNKTINIEKNKLTLITCVDNSKNRLIINAYKLA